MTTLKELKAKYSGQAVPEWELVNAGLKAAEAPVAAAPETEKRKPGRPKKVAEAEADVEIVSDEVTPNGDSDAN